MSDVIAIFARNKIQTVMKSARIIAGMCLAMLLCFAPSAVCAQQTVVSVEDEVLPVRITVSENTAQDVRVQNAEGQKLEVYNLIGVRVSVYRIDSADKTITLGVQRGCYILKVGKVVRKVFVR